MREGGRERKSSNSQVKNEIVEALLRDAVMEPNCRQKHTDAGISLFWDAPPKHRIAPVIQLMDPGEIKAPQ